VSPSVQTQPAVLHEQSPLTQTPVSQVSPSVQTHPSVLHAQAPSIQTPLQQILLSLHGQSVSAQDAQNFVAGMFDAMQVVPLQQSLVASHTSPTLKQDNSLFISSG